ncbi:MAG: DNA mismatch repair endonuclease MutL [Bacillota bacterium]|nr:DNA mismatch repair endonuclease MutL [Bacillota bacterium]
MEMRRIQKLDEFTASKIAAGEVVERPAMVVKELVENAIDAGADEIVIDVKNGGKKSIRVSDNGSGIHIEDLTLVFERHATSKIRSIEDLYDTHSLGFRGEALSSICAVSQVEMITMCEGDSYGIKIQAAGGKILKQSEVGAIRGTSIFVKDLFFNTPARLKFLKSDQAEGRSITELVSTLAISHPEIAFKYVNDDKLVFHTPGKGDLGNAIFSIYEAGILKHLHKISESHDDISIHGFVSKFDYTKGTKSHQLTFVNGRYVKSDVVKDVVQMAYKPYLMNNRHAVCFLFINVPPSSVDVNIHPAKTEIKFHDEGKIKQLIYMALKKSFNLYDQVPSVTFSEKEVFVRPPAIEAQELDAIEPEPRINQQNEMKSDRKVSSTPKVSPPAFTPEKVDFEAISQMNAFVEDMVRESPEIIRDSVYDGLDFIGVFDKTYLLFEKNSQLVMIDQHAAHEKILYEQFMRAFKSQEIASQLLLIPETVELDALDMSSLDQMESFITNMGFEFERFGNSTVILREIPSLLSIQSAKLMFSEILEGTRTGMEDHFEEKLASKACKAAIKAYDTIQSIEVDALVEQLSILESPYTCPHGRPIVIQFGKHEIERKFKRIL